MGYMKEFGRAGQKRTGGIFYEEFLPELQGKKGIETYREMAGHRAGRVSSIRGADSHSRPAAAKRGDRGAVEPV